MFFFFPLIGYMARRLMKVRVILPSCSCSWIFHPYSNLRFSTQALEDLSMQYDTTVRNSENTVVQFTYGDDGLNPEKMEHVCTVVEGVGPLASNPCT